MALSRATPAEVAAFRAITSVKDVADFFQLPQARLAFHLYSALRPAYYRFTIPKSAGGLREIHSPPPLIRSMQSRLLRCIEALTEPRPQAHGFTRERSVKTNARAHLGAHWLLNLDLLDFFPSIHFGRVRGVFLARPFYCSPSVASVLSQLCCYRGILPQGAPTSPAISNVVCRGLDRDLARFARAHDCRYTRYADDITFSTVRDRLHSDLVVSPSPLERPVLGDDLLRLLTAHGFKLNAAKTRLRGRAERQAVTGVVINQKLNVPRAFVRNIRSILHDCEARGITAADRRFRLLIDGKSRRGSPPSLDRHTRGKLAYLRMIRGAADGVYLALAIRAERAFPARRGQGVVILGSAAHSDRFLSTAIFIIVGRDLRGDIIRNGTAFAVQGVGVVTAQHVFEDPACISYELRPTADPTTVYPIVAIRFRAEYDLAVLEPSPRIIGCIRRSTENAAVGDPITLAGHPDWRSPADSLLMSAGRVIWTRTAGGTDYILIDAAIRGGSSGGPLLSKDGTALGVAVYDESSPIAPNGVIPIRHVDDVASAPLVPVGMK